MADVKSTLAEWSTTAGSNSPSGGTSIGTGLDDNLREIQKVVRYLASPNSIAAATSTDLSTIPDTFVTVTCSTTVGITGLGTISSGIYKWLVFSNSGTLTLAHNATSLILPTAANITVADKDTALMLSLGSGNWRCLSYNRANGANVLNASTFADGNVSAPGIAFTDDTNTGIYRIGADSIGVSTGGTLRATLAAAMSLTPATSLALTTGALTATTTGAMSLTSGGTFTLTGTAGYAVNIVGTLGNPGDGSDINITGGSSATAAGGDVTITGGGGSGGSSGAAGDVILKPGAGDPHGNIDLYAVAVNAPALRINGEECHVEVYETALMKPAITSGGGSGAAINGSDVAFKLTLGTSPGTTDIVITFANAFTYAPIVIAQYQSADIALRALSTTTNITITPAASMGNYGIIDVHVIGYR